LSVIIPVVLLSIPRFREDPNRLYLVAILTVGGFVANRLNIAVTGMERWAGVRYIPRWSEVAVTLSMVGVGIVLFSYAVKYLPIFSHGHERKLAV
jgi:molybdopterin-containing oxidoreductase family membrane subunit